MGVERYAASGTARFFLSSACGVASCRISLTCLPAPHIDNNEDDRAFSYLDFQSGFFLPIFVKKITK